MKGWRRAEAAREVTWGRWVRIGRGWSGGSVVYSGMDGRGSSRFHTTHWSLIAALPGRGDDREAGRAQEALEHLCDAYWRPLYAFARYRGYSVEEAQDLTQAFLARVIETGGLGGADPDRGRFRSYVLGAMKHFMAHARTGTGTGRPSAAAGSASSMATSPRWNRVSPRTPTPRR